LTFDSVGSRGEQQFRDDSGAVFSLHYHYGVRRREKATKREKALGEREDERGYSTT
jgi:hypothetical protein